MIDTRHPKQEALVHNYFSSVVRISGQWKRLWFRHQRGPVRVDYHPAASNLGPNTSPNFRAAYFLSITDADIGGEKPRAARPE
jgi:hypothetical protein